MFDTFETTQDGIKWRLEVMDNVAMLMRNGVMVYGDVPDEMELALGPMDKMERPISPPIKIEGCSDKECLCWG